MAVADIFIGETGSGMGAGVTRRAGNACLTHSHRPKTAATYFFAAASTLAILMELPSALASPVTLTVPPAFA